MELSGLMKNRIYLEAAMRGGDAQSLIAAIENCGKTFTDETVMLIVKASNCGCYSTDAVIEQLFSEEEN